MTAAVLNYTGTWTSAEYTADGKKYTLYTITGSGALVVEGKAKNVDIWSCGGGSSGVSTIGGAGAYCAEVSALTLSGDYVVTVGAAGGNSSVSSKGVSVLAANGVSRNRNGGTGGGGYGKGDGVAKYPFSDSTTFKCHCAGGGGGLHASWTFMSGSASYSSTGAGGSNGGNGGGSGSGTSGGNYGGGNGGSASADQLNTYGGTGRPATFYGSGGGGGGYAESEASTGSSGSGGAGYQGIVYIRVPA